MTQRGHIAGIATRRGLALGLLLAIVPGGPVSTTAANDVIPAVRTVIDGSDAIVRRTDACGAQFACGPTPLPSDWTLPDLQWLRMGRWSPTTPVQNRYVGAFAPDGAFLRIDLVFAGLVNPPGPVVASYQPLAFGDHPLFGFVELDVDTNGNTGGEIDAPLRRYAGNAARFGGRPAGSAFANRVSLDGRDPDNLPATLPWIERSGADFELELRGDEISAIVQTVGDADGVFEAREVWDLRGRFFRRTQGYDDCAGGAYTPEVWLRFSHCDANTSAPCPVSIGPAISGGVTVVTFVYPLTNAAYASANGLAAEANDVYDFNAHSVLEGLTAVAQAAQFQLCPPSDPWWPLIADWQMQDPADHLEPQRWRAAMLWGTARASAVAGEGNFIWTDIFPNVLPGDFNGDGLRTRTDARLARAFLAAHDGDPLYDADLTSNGAIALVNFGVWFSVFDVDYDGVVGVYDLAFVQQELGDHDNDGDVDLADYAAFQACLTATAPGATEAVGCRDAFDADDDGAVRLTDFDAFLMRLSGP